jgi:aldehyde:ferredoxin oxidoreductase
MPTPSYSEGRVNTSSVEGAGMGHWKRLLEVDLTTGSSRTRELSEEFVRQYLGGAGFTTRILYDEVGPDVDPLDPENVVAVAPGLLVGPSVPTGSKTSVGFKSPLTGGYGKSMVGAKLSDQLKRAGYDALVVEGAADDPVALVVDDDEVSVEPAADLWGRDTQEASDAIQNEYGQEFRTAVIGPAGENESFIAGIECEDRQAGRGGGGAVMGSKRLKAIAVRGSHDPSAGESIDEDAYERELDRYYAVRGFDDCGTPLWEHLVELDLPEAADEVGVGNEQVA